VSVQWPATTAADLERGRVVYVRRCSACHTLVLPTTHAAEDWPALVEVMSDRARLTPSEKTDVVRFLMALTTPPPP
jgi:mono/diheme cytochrome c family protein